MKKIFFLLLSFIFLSANAQDIAMADEMRASGKIYVVVGVLLIILVGMLFYLVSIDRKVTKLEKELKEK